MNDIEHEPAARRTFHVFVSHISEESDVALALQRMLQDLFDHDVEVFTSSDSGKSIQAGSDWLKRIQSALGQAGAVIVLCSRASVKRPWVQFELGAAWMRNLPIIPVCHSGMKATELPMPLSTRDAVEIDVPGLAALYAALAEHVTRRPADPAKIAAHLAMIQRAELAFKEQPLVQYELALNAVLPPPGKLDGPRIPDEATVELNDETAALFDYRNGPLTWGQVQRAALKASPDGRWLDQLATCVWLSGGGQRFESVQAVFHCDQGSFQPQLSHREILPNGLGRYHVHLVETVVARVMDADNAFGLLATLLRLGLRVRYEVIERCIGPLSVVQHLPAADRAAETARLRSQVRLAIETIACDAKSRGAPNFGTAQILLLFERDAERTEIAGALADWRAAQAQLACGDPPPDAALMHELLSTMRDVNFRFMRLATRRFHEMVEASWAPAAAGA